MKKKLLYALLPFCCVAMSSLYADEDKELSSEVAVSSEEPDQVPESAAPPALFKKKCNCPGGK